MRTGNIAGKTSAIRTHTHTLNLTRNKSIWNGRKTARFTTNIGKVNNFLIYTQKSRENIIFECAKTLIMAFRLNRNTTILMLASHVSFVWHMQQQFHFRNGVEDGGDDTQTRINIQCHFDNVTKTVDIRGKQFIMRNGSSGSLRFRMHWDFRCRFLTQLSRNPPIETLREISSNATEKKPTAIKQFINFKWCHQQVTKFLARTANQIFEECDEESYKRYFEDIYRIL